MAARKLRFSLRRSNNSFVWLDHVSGRVIACPPYSDAKKALLAACEILANELSCHKT